MNDAKVETTFPPSLAFPTSRYPTGWFQIGWSDEVAPGAVRLVRYFGRDIVVWRGESGRLYATDAYCLHIGGNLGVNGRVDGEEIVCPWHGWHWDGEGCNTLIPYGSQPCKRNIRLETWTVRDWYGSIVCWHDLSGRPPQWEPPVLAEIDDDTYFPFEAEFRAQYRLKAHVQMPGENAADLAHLVYVHGAGSIPDYIEYRFVDHEWFAKVASSYGGGKRSTWLTPDGEIHLVLDFYNQGVGMGYARWPHELVPSLMVTNHTPVDDTYTDQFFTMTTARGGAGDRPTGLARKMIEHQKRTVEQDHFTWQNMKVLDTPNFTPEEMRYWSAYRGWATQFYPETVLRRVPVPLNGDGAHE